MKINRKTHLELRLQNLLFTLLFLVAMGLLGWLSTRYSAQFDWTASNRHTLSDASRKVLDLLQGPVTITAYARENTQERQRIADQIGRYSRYKKDITLQFVNPDTQPDKVRELGITTDGELLIDYQGRSDRIQEAGEAAMTNALQRLMTAKERHVVFLEGHGERSPRGQANHDLGQFGDELERKGITVSMVNLAVTSAIPDNTDVLVLAGPRVKLMPGEVAQIQNYVKQGGNFLWLVDPSDVQGLAPLAEQLGLKFLPGVVVDASSQVLGIDDPTFALVAEYGPHPITQDFQEMTVFPEAVAMEPAAKSDFEPEAILSTLPRSWTETGKIEGKIAFDTAKGERSGPLDIGYALTRQVTPPTQEPAKPAAGKVEPASPATDSKQPRTQRIVVVGDGDFLSNAFLGNGGNLDLGVHILQWLNHSDALINIPSKTAPDRKLDLSPLASGSIAVGFLFILPLILIGTGAVVWFKRRRS